MHGYSFVIVIVNNSFCSLLFLDLDQAKKQ